MAMGVFQMADLSGLDVFVHVGRILTQAYASRAYPSTIGQCCRQCKGLATKVVMKGGGRMKYPLAGVGERKCGN